MTSPTRSIRVDHFRHAVVTTDAQGNTFVHNRVAGDDPAALAAPDASTFTKVDAVLSGILTGFLIFATIEILGWAKDAVVWAVSR